MDKLKLCATNFYKLLNIEYKIIIGKKNKIEEIHLKFSEVDFHHLMGIGKLKSLYVARENREKVFRKIITDKLKYVDINKENKYFCKSFFQKDKKDYSERQPRYKLLYKEKINTLTNEKIIQYNVLK